MNVLLCIPFGPYPHRIHTLTLNSTAALNMDTAHIETPQGSRHDKAELCRKHNEARRLTLDGGYDALLHVDADMVIPPDALERLFNVDADVVYGLYVSRQTPSRWLCFTDIQDADVLSKDKRLAKKLWGQVVPSFGAGMGCTLIRRNVLDRLAFRTDGNTGSDWWFAVDANNYEFSQAHHLGCMCGHIDGDKVYWPDVTQPSFYRTELI